MDDMLNAAYAVDLSKCSTLPYYRNCMTKEYISYKMVHKELPWDDVITYVNIGLGNKFYTNTKTIEKPDSITVLVNKYNQLPCSYVPSDLEEIDSDFSDGPLVLRHDARIAFENMGIYAWTEGIHLQAISTYRSFSYQDTVYYRKLTPEVSMEDYQSERDKVSARAGYSEHQTGLAVDINDLEETFEETPEGKWLAANAYRFGFILRYPKGKEAITGYSYEPWHFRYLGQCLAEDIYISGLTYDEFYVRYIAC